MEVFKLLIFAIVLALVAMGGVMSYRWLNRKIMASEKLGGVIGHALLLIAINLLILAGGAFLLLYLYGFLFPGK